MILKNGKRLDSCSDTVPIGTINPYAGSVAPYGYLICAGQLVSKTTYKELYEICGDTFGTSTDTEFYLPDLRGKTITGYKEGDSTFGTIGALIGALTHVHSTGNHTLTIDEMPSHDHPVPSPASDSSPLYLQNKASNLYGGSSNGSGSGAWEWSKSIVPQGGNGAHSHGDTGSSSNLQPSVNMNWIIKAFVLMPNQSYVEDSLESTSTVNSLSAAQGKILNDKIELKQNGLTTTQLNACNSGITASKVASYDSDISDTGWVNLTLLNGATDYDTGASKLSYRKIGKIVYLSGLINIPEMASLTTIAILPEGCRPHYNYESFVIRNNEGYCRAGINKGTITGEIWVQGAVAGETSFSNICFIADN